MATVDEIRRFWDEDAATYDRARGHRPRTSAERAAWTAALERLLPPPPARILDAGAGTGFLSLIAARLGHRVTAVDISTRMLAVLRRSAAAENLDIEVLTGSATERRPGFDAVMERHLVWTLTDPEEGLRAWRESAPAGRLVLIESMWGNADPVEALRSRARELARRVLGQPADHHASYATGVRESLPLGFGTHPNDLIELVLHGGWSNPRLERLRDVEWAALNALHPAQRLLGVSPRFAIVAS